MESETMSDRLLPETIRGGWYFVPSDEPASEAVEEEGKILVFHLDGTFVRFEIEQEERTEAERGEYTFDGDFLILRGDRTNTYRVHPEAPWRWSLEGKKGDQVLLRGIVDREETIELGEERREEIERMPMRVFVRSIFEGAREGEICMFIHEADDEEIAIGALFADAPKDAEMWVGVTPFVEGLSAEIWERIVRESYLDIHRDDLGGLARIDMHFFGLDRSRSFEL
jgi:hypothetical protein